MRNLFAVMLVSLAFTSFTKNVNADGVISEEKDVYSFTLNDIDGKSVNLGQFKGRALLIVNTASRCGYTPQYKSLEALYDRYKDRGLVVLGFPANNFMGQEPGSNEEIKKFCSLKFKVTFPMFSKISVSGNDIHPLYQYLTSRPSMEGPISWNFNKFLIAPKGNVVARYDSSVDPLSQEITSTLEKVLTK